MATPPGPCRRPPARTGPCATLRRGPGLRHPALTGAQQAAIGFECGGQIATRLSPITSCAGQGTATRLSIPKDGTFNPDTNPPRIAPRNLFDIGVGTDNLLHGDHKRIILRFTVVNLTNQASLYNFLSTFSGTHWVAPRTYEAALGFAF